MQIYITITTRAPVAGLRLVVLRSQQGRTTVKSSGSKEVGERVASRFGGSKVDADGLAWLVLRVNGPS